MTFRSPNHGEDIAIAVRSVDLWLPYFYFSIKSDCQKVKDDLQSSGVCTTDASTNMEWYFIMILVIVSVAILVTFLYTIFFSGGAQNDNSSNDEPEEELPPSSAGAVMGSVTGEVIESAIIGSV